jgi:hypothetical protein
MSEQIEQRVVNIENLMSYMAETQRMMAENITKLTDVQVELKRSQIVLEQKQIETDERFNVLLSEIRHLSKRVNEE